MDDRVRGGSSRSYLELVGNASNIRFSGHLDTKTLGGAGFASQSTQGDKVWDLSGFEGIQLEVVKADNKTYTFIVKDEIPGSKRDDGREKSSISWEHNFKLDDQDTSELLQHNVTIPWNRFKATYRGREKEDAHPLKVSEIRKFSLMMRRQDAPLSAHSKHATNIYIQLLRRTRRGLRACS